MVYVLTLVTPLALLVLMLGMERVEQPLRRDAVGEQLVDFLETARPEEVETYVSQGFAPALDRYWRRRRSAVGPGRTEATTTAGTTVSTKASAEMVAVRPASSRTDVAAT